MDKNNLTLEEQFKHGMIEPGEAIKFNQTIELQFQDNQIADLQESYQNISLTVTESASGKKTKPYLIITVEGIHTGMTKNLTFYPGSTLEESVPTWTAPHNKPVLKNHDVSTEPLGRIIGAEYVESTLTDKYTVRLKLRVTDQDAIEKLLDGRYLTLSVGGSAKRVNCSICGKDLIQEGWCGHSRGRTYEGKQAHWTIGNYTGDEISFVNMPADVYSQVIAVEMVTGEGGKNMDGKNTEGTQTGAEQTPENPTPASQTEGSIIDNLLGDEGEGEGVTTTEGDNPESGEAGTQVQEGAGATDPEPEGGQPEETLEEKVARLEGELAEAQTQVTAITTERDNALAENATLVAQLDEKDQHIKSAEEERDTFKEQAKTLARYSRKQVAERVVDLRINQGKDNAESREELVAEWSKSSTKVLESQITDLLAAPRKIATVTNPGTVITDKNSITVDENGNEIHTQESSNSSKPKIKTLGDLTEGMTNYMARNF